MVPGVQPAQPHGHTANAQPLSQLVPARLPALGLLLPGLVGSHSRGVLMVAALLRTVPAQRLRAPGAHCWWETGLQQMEEPMSSGAQTSGERGWGWLLPFSTRAWPFAGMEPPSRGQVDS